MSRNIVIFLFIFINFLNPISIFLTLAFNIFLFLFLLTAKNTENFRSIKLNTKILGIVFAILFWLIIVFFINGSFNTIIIGKYLRSTISTILILLICAQLRLSSSKLIPILSLIFICHIGTIGIQSLFPQLDIPMAEIFGFNRDVDIINSMSIRKMGLSSSYDTATLISLLSMAFFFIQYINKDKNILLFLSFLSLLSTLRTSRTGMILGIILFVLFLTYVVFTSKGRKKVASFVFLCFGLFLAINYILPILASTTVSFLADTKYNNIEISNYDYSTGSEAGLTGSHLNALNISFIDLIIGLGIDPNNIPGKASDVGYVKLIYHIGIVGLLLILSLYGYFVKKAVLLRHYVSRKSDEFIISNFILIYIILILIINYKSLEVYSRGSHDLLLIIFLALTFKSKKTKIFNNSMS